MAAERWFLQHQRINSQNSRTESYAWWFRNPANRVDMVNITFFTRFYICRVQDFWTINSSGPFFHYFSRVDTLPETTHKGFRVLGPEGLRFQVLTFLSFRACTVLREPTVDEKNIQLRCAWFARFVHQHYCYRNWKYRHSDVSSS